MAFPAHSILRENISGIPTVRTVVVGIQIVCRKAVLDQKLLLAGSDLGELSVENVQRVIVTLQHAPRAGYGEGADGLRQLLKFGDGGVDLLLSGTAQRSVYVPSALIFFLDGFILRIGEGHVCSPFLIGIERFRQLLNSSCSKASKS